MNSSFPQVVTIHIGRDAFASKNIKFYYFKGNFLNWLTMSKMDLIKKALTGGKPDRTYTSTLRGESRACVGRRFIKQYPVPSAAGSSGIAFAVLGSDVYGHGYSNIYVGGLQESRSIRQATAASTLHLAVTQLLL